MLIGTCSFGSSGSSAVSDYLAEFDETQVLDRTEFTWVSATDSLIYLEFHLMNPHGRTNHSALAIRRYMDFVAVKAEEYERRFKIPRQRIIQSAAEFIEAITDTMWDGYIPNNRPGFFEKHVGEKLLRKKLIPKIERKLGHAIRMYPMQDFRFSLNNPNFYPAARKHMNELLQMLGADFSKKIVLDQPFPGNAPEKCFPFFDDPMAIVVDRDPRDLYVFAKTKLLGLNHFMPVNSAESFVAYYRALRSVKSCGNDSERVMYIRFEDMVYNYDSATARLREFCGLPENPRPKSIFKPEKSLANTQVFKRFPQYSRDVEYIESELPEYLFDYEKYGDIKIPDKMFFGRAHK